MTQKILRVEREYLLKQVQTYEVIVPDGSTLVTDPNHERFDFGAFDQYVCDNGRCTEEHTELIDDDQLEHTEVWKKVTP